MESLNHLLEILRTVATLAVPVVLAFAAHAFQKKQKFFESVMSEKVKHYSQISPLLNQVFAYRYRVGDFLDRTPESILEAKRRADHEFWTFEYLWSEDFRSLYKQFMDHSFTVFGKEGTRARLRVNGNLYPVKPTVAGWDAFTGEEVDRKELGRLYSGLKRAIARDLGFREYK